MRSRLAGFRGVHLICCVKRTTQGSVPRGRAPDSTGYEERRARETLSVLLEKGLLKSVGPRAPVTLALPEKVLARWLPALYPVDSPRSI
jgi:hypothetical protein